MSCDIKLLLCKLRRNNIKSKLNDRRPRSKIPLYIYAIKLKQYIIMKISVTVQ